MKAQRRFGLNLSWPRLTTVFLIDVVVLVLASHWPGRPQDAIYAWWSGVGIAVVITLVALITVWRTPITGLVGARVLDRFVDPEPKLGVGRTPALDHQRRFGRDTVGIREYRGRVVSVIAVEGRTERRAGRHHYRVVSPVTLPVGSVASWLRQFDVHLDAIDVVSVGRLRSEDLVGDEEHAEDAESDSEEERAPVDHRGTWLVLRMDPQRNTAAVAARDSVASTLAAATERIAQDIDGTHCAARPLTAVEIAEVDTAVLAGVEPERLRARRHWLTRKLPAVPRAYLASFWVSPGDITTETLSQLWLPGADEMALTTRIAHQDGETGVAAWVRYHSDEKLGKGVWAGLNRITGRQLAAVRASLPVPAGRPLLAVPTRPLGDDEELEVPVGSASQYSMKQVETRP